MQQKTGHSYWVSERKRIIRFFKETSYSFKRIIAETIKSAILKMESIVRIAGMYFAMNKKVYSINEIKNIVEPLAREYGVESLFLFGSYAKGVADENSDVDFRIDKGDVRGIRFAGLYTDLEEVLGKNVDLVTTASLDESFKKSIANEEILLYAR